MEVRFIPDPEQEAFIRQGIASGRYRTAEDAVRVPWPIGSKTNGRA